MVSGWGNDYELFRDLTMINLLSREFKNEPTIEIAKQQYRYWYLEIID